MQLPLRFAPGGDFCGTYLLPSAAGRD